ncbi:hypothetical protein [Terribacillus saccharophilus]|uniref:hypothetical protein n=1 Tax=Terribacillus saccharophilus TaxID=361277 RepID=UPI002989FA09|nr:hypothetical protein [Terribacillus saccharophilus]MCM3225967.1 hypothetical protein [Terribacillus saccharophilus]
MDKKKYAIFAIFALVFIVYFGYSYYKSNLSAPEAEHVTLKEGNYTVGKDIQAGIYDINIKSGETEFRGQTVDKGDKLIGIELYSEETFDISGKVEIEFSPTSYTNVEENDDIYTINHSGNYIVGKQIPPGTYSIKFNNPDSVNLELAPFIQISENIGTGIISSVELQKNKDELIEMKSDNVLFVSKSMNEEYNKVSVELTPVK